MPELTKERLAEIEARAAKAFPGPWASGWSGRGDVYSPGRQHPPMNPIVDKALTKADADFIAHARTDIPLLIAEVRRLRTQYDELRDALCSKSWAPRDNHDRVVALAKMMKRRESKIEAAIAKLAAGRTM